MNQSRPTFCRLVAVALVAGVVLGAGCTQSPEVKKQKALERAERHLKDGKPNEAIIELRNALQVDKDFVPGLHALGRAYAARLWYADAIRELGRAQSLSPDSVPIARDLGRAAVELGAWKQADEQAERILTREPNSSEALFIRVQARLGQGKADEALAILDGMSGSGADSATERQVLRGQALLSLRKVDEAEQAFRAAHAANAKDPRSLMGLGQISLARRKFPEAAQLFADAKALREGDPRIRLGLAAAKAQMKQMPEAIRELEGIDPRARTLTVILALGAYYLEGNRPLDAIQLLAPVVQRLPKMTQARFLLAGAYLTNNQPEYAVTELEALARDMPNHPLIQFRLAQAYLRRGRSKDALTRLDAVAKTFEKAPDYHLERARTFVMLGRLDDAMQAIGVVQKLAPQWPHAYLLAGQIRLQQGNKAAARDLYAKAAELDAGFAPAHLALGRLNAADQDIEGAMKEFDAALAADPQSIAAVRTKTVSLVQQKRTKEAIAFVESKIKQSPKQAQLHALLGTLYVTERQFEKAGAAYKTAVDIDPRSVEPRLGLARVSLSQNRDDEALNHLLAVVKQRPEHRTAVLLLASVADRLGRYDQAIPSVEAAVKATPGQPDLVLTAGELYVKVGRYDDAISAMNGLLALAPSMGSARIVRGEAYLAKRDAAAAMKDFTAVVEANPKSALARYLLARAHVAVGQAPQARKQYEEALRLDPKLELARTELAVLSGQKPDEATQVKRIDELREAVKRDPKNVGLREALARALLRQGQVKEGQAELKQLLEQVPGHPTGNFLMAQVLASQGSPDEAANHLRAALRGNPSHLEANVHLGRYLESKGRREEAVALYEAALRVNPNLLDVKLQLGQLYAQGGRLPDALRVVQEVERAAPQSAGPVVLKGFIQMAQKDFKAATESFNLAIKILPDAPDSHRGLAQAMEGLGQTDRAIESYRKVLSLNGNDIVALNNLAWILLETKKRPDEALPLAVKAERLAPQMPTVLDTLGWVHFRRGTYPEAEKLLVRAVERAPGNGVIQYHLGMTYAKLGKKNDAVSVLRRATQLDPKLAQTERISDVIKDLGG